MCPVTIYCIADVGLKYNLVVIHPNQARSEKSELRSDDTQVVHSRPVYAAPQYTMHRCKAAITGPMRTRCVTPVPLASCLCVKLPVEPIYSSTFLRGEGLHFEQLRKKIHGQI